MLSYYAKKMFYVIFNKVMDFLLKNAYSPYKHWLFLQSQIGGIMNFFSNKRNLRIIAAVIALLLVAAMVVTTVAYF